jgi:hypothetical protein
MRLARVDIENFRCIRAASVHLDHCCKILIGLNESGKTAVLDALGLLAPGRSPVPGDTRMPTKREQPISKASVRFVFTFSESDRRALLATCKARILSLDADAPLLIAGSTGLSVGRYVRTRGGVYFVDVKTRKANARYWSDSTQYSMGQDWYAAPKPLPGELLSIPATKPPLSLDTVTLVHRSVLTDAAAGRLQKANPDLVKATVGEVVADYIAENLPQVVVWKYRPEYLLPGRINFDEFSANPEMCVPLKNMFLLAGHDDPAAAIKEAQTQSSLGVRNLMEYVADKATRHLKKAWTECRGVSFHLSPDGPSITASIRDKFNHYEMQQRSDGFRFFVSFLLVVSAKVRSGLLENALILIDEPEIGLHPSGARFLLRELVQLSKTNTVVLSTHSVFMIDRDRIERHVIVKKTNEVTDLHEATDSNYLKEEVLFQAIGTSVFETLRLKNVIVEGWQDRHLFEVALTSKALLPAGLRRRLKEAGMVHAGGVKLIRQVASVLELARREYVVVSDGDDPALQHQREYEKERRKGPWLRYDTLLPGRCCFTAEDLLKSEVVEREAKATFGEFGVEGFPGLSDLALNRGVVAGLSSWVAQQGRTGDDLKVLLRRLKEGLFQDLRPDQIQPAFAELARAVLDRLGA